MILLLLAYVGGVLTILSPCVLPVLPFVFARAGRPFVSSILPMLIGMALTFALVATLAAVGGGWVVRANEYGRDAALVLLALFGLMLLSTRLADRLTQPLVRLGSRLSPSERSGSRGTPVSSLILGVAVGFLWAPCAGPILGLILTGAALRGANTETSLLLFTYAAGAATSLALALLVGGRLFALFRRSLGVSEWLRRALGAAVLGAVLAIAFGADTGFLTRLSLSGTSRIEQGLMDHVRPAAGMKANAGGANGTMTMTGSGGMMMSGAMTGAHGTARPNDSEGDLPSLSGAVAWLNSAPLTPEGLRGKVVLVDFWTYSCINCLRTLPYIRAWAQKYRDHGLVVIGVHTPEFAFEKNIDNVRHAVRELSIRYPVAVDNNYAIWSAFLNNYWPADYFIDAKGQIRGHAFGEGDYDQSERRIQSLLSAAGFASVPTDLVTARGTGVEAAPDADDVQSPETYVGYDRAQSVNTTPGIVHDAPQQYSTPRSLSLNQWGFDGTWTVEGEKALLTRASGRIVFRFHARDLHLVLGPSSDGRPVRYRVLLDGVAPVESHGVDTDAEGHGVVRDQRLYQLIRQSGPIKDRTFAIEFEDPGVQAFSFTFG
jgi:cytochrome c biogenesis protein CcdA/thiol-disulfide isomerase/thioredoxin